MARDEGTPIADRAAERVAKIVAAAEKQAAEIEAEARGEAERIVAAARREAEDQVERAQGAVNRLIQQADELRSAVGKLGSDLASQAKGSAPSAETTPEVVPEPPQVPEPTPPREPEPQPPLTPEPTPPQTPEPTPPQTPEPQPPGPEITGKPSTEDLLTQLKGDAGDAGDAEGAGNGRSTGADDAADVAAARLVAMKMALEGASREEIGRHLEESYSLSQTDDLLDDVLARARP